ncbi:MAG: carbohydrate ABC transporter permease [Firmicutes bacterium]|jgi:sn-glycerol 3-phosphate transport system permease protein|nr:carbohydrate ABC transporter permease [Bacillota bacterium]
MKDNFWRKNLGRVFDYIVLTFFSIVILTPLFWIVVTSLKSQADIFRRPLAILPSEVMFSSNMQEVLRRAPWTMYFRNTIALVFGLLAVQLVVSVLAAYAFAFYNFKGKNVIFILVLLRLMISPDSVVLPNYLTIMRLNIMDTLLAVGLPFVGSAQAILLFRQAFLQLPKELKESAQVDGCGDLRFLQQIGVPLIKPSILTFSIISIVYQWNAFFWPMLVTESNAARTLPVGLAQFGLRAESGSEWGLTMAATLLVIAPILITFAIFQKQFINSFLRSGLK